MGIDFPPRYTEREYRATAFHTHQLCDCGRPAWIGEGYLVIAGPGAVNSELEITYRGAREGVGPTNVNAVREDTTRVTDIRINNDL